MSIIGSTQSLPDSYGLVLLLLRLSGLFPFEYVPDRNKFKISCKFFTLTVLHIVMYTYVNITSLLENWMDFAQPMIGHSSLTALGNLILRVGAIIITFAILIPLVFGSLNFVSSLNYYVYIIDEFEKLDINVKRIYRRVYISSCLATAIIAVTLIFTAWHSIYFYKLITNHPPAFKYYLMAFLADYYKVLYIFYGNLQLITVNLLANQLNEFLDTLVQTYQQDYEKKLRIKEFLKEKN